MTTTEPIVGIDLGTTNSEVAALQGERIRVLGPGDQRMLPSCVGLAADGSLLIGEPARNQSLVYPDRTVRSIKRKMGSDEKAVLGKRSYSPQEISALILRQLSEWATQALGVPARKAVITVPAYFSDSQRHATREAGELANLEVARILNEPTAAALAYGGGDEGDRTVMVYDLGGGTFDVSIVRIEGDVTEVLASHGNNRLGGDDFDQLLVARLLGEFREAYGIDLQDSHPAGYSRLWWAAEEAKKRLSAEPYATIREDGLATVDGKPLHFEREVTREEYEDLIGPLVESTLDSVSRALEDAKLRAASLDAILLVGGSTRTPLVARVLEERTGLAPRRDMHPDLCVALGAGLLASRLAGSGVRRVLVDVSPFSFGISHLGERDGSMYPYCYIPTIERNTPLPITRSQAYSTSHPFQETVEIQVFQGEDPDALKNIKVGEFLVSGLKPMEDANEVLVRMQLDLEGILNVSAIEKCTGLSKQISITGALEPKSPKEMGRARDRLADLFRSKLEDSGVSDVGRAVVDGGEEDEAIETRFSIVEPEEETPESAEKASEGLSWEASAEEARRLLARSRSALDDMHADDQEEAIDLHERIEAALQAREREALSTAVEELRELLFFLEGK